MRDPKSEAQRKRLLMRIELSLAALPRPAPGRRLFRITQILKELNRIERGWGKGCSIIPPEIAKRAKIEVPPWDGTDLWSEEERWWEE